MKGLVFSKSLIEIVDREMPAWANKFSPSLMPLTDNYLNFAKSLSNSELERVSKRHIPQFSRITITLSTVMRVSTQSKIGRILLLIFSQLTWFLIIFAQRLRYKIRKRLFNQLIDYFLKKIRFFRCFYLVFIINNCLTDIRYIRTFFNI